MTDAKTPARRAVDSAMALATAKADRKAGAIAVAGPLLQALVYAVLDVADAIREGHP